MSPTSRSALLLVAAAVCACSGQTSQSTRRDAPPARSQVFWPSGNPPQVRAQLSKATREGGAHVRVRGTWTLRDLSGAEIASGAGIDGPLSLARTGWRLAALPAPTDGAELAPDEDGDLEVGDRSYKGTLRVSQSLDGEYRVFVTSGMPDYLAGVVTGEIPAAFPTEAQRTQAIIARTYTLSRAPQAFRGDPILVSDSGSQDQEFHGIPHVTAHRRVAQEAVHSTRGLTVMDGRRPVHTWYHSTCGGRTSPSGPVFGVETTGPLSGVLCGHCTASKYFSWTTEIPSADVVRAAGLSGSLEDVHVAAFSAGGRATAFSVSADGRTMTVDAGRLRLAIGPSLLRSVFVRSLRVDGGVLRVEGNGWGHGVGLCQMGAKGLAEEGLEAEAILTTYYPGSEVARLW